MKIPEEEENQKKLSKILEKFDADLFTSLINSKELLSSLYNDSKQIIHLLNLLDSYLEIYVSFLISFAKNNLTISKTCNSEEKEIRDKILEFNRELISRETVETRIFQILTATSFIFTQKTFRTCYRSLDRLLEILIFSESMENFTISLNIFSKFFSEDGLAKRDYEYVEDNIPKLLYLCKFFVNHVNSFSYDTFYYTDFFSDDERYPLFLKATDTKPKEINYSDNLFFEFVYPCELGLDYKDLFEVKEDVLEEKKRIVFKIDSILEKFPNQNAYTITKNILSANEVKNLQDNTPLFHALLFRIRLAMKIKEYNNRIDIVKVSLVSLQLYFSFIKVFSGKKSSIINRIFTATLDFSNLMKDILYLFYLKLTPNFHVQMVQIITGILCVDNQFDYKEILSQLTSQYHFFQKVFKDCTALQINEEKNKIESISAVVLPIESAENPIFLEELLQLLKKEIRQFFLDEENNLIANHIYSISTIVSSLITILETEILPNGKSLYTIQSCHYVGEIMWNIIPNQDIGRDFNILEKIIIRLEKDLKLLLDGAKILEFRNGNWVEVDKKVFIEYIAYMLKLIDSPFFRKINLRSQMAPTLARKLMDSEILPLCKKIILGCDPKETEKIFIHAIILIGDIAREVPNLIGRLIEMEIISVFLEKFEKEIPRDGETLPMIIYFINMFCLNEKGIELEARYKIIDKIFELLFRKDFVETIYLNLSIENNYIPNLNQTNFSKISLSMVFEFFDLVQR